MNIHSIKPYVVLVVVFATSLFIAHSIQNGNFSYGFKKQNLQKEILNEYNYEWLKDFTVPENKDDHQTQPIPYDPDAPELNTLYLGKYKNTDAIFITDTTSQTFFTKEGIRESSPYYGKIVWDNRSSSVDFRDLVDFKKIYTFTKIGYLSSFLLNDSRTILYVSTDFDIYTISDPWNPYTEIRAINISDQTTHVVWSNITEEKLNSPARLSKMGGDKYLLLYRLACYSCGGGSRGIAVVNIVTEKQKFLPFTTNKLGNIQFHLDTGTFSYQKLKAIPDPCEAAKNCDGIPSSTYVPEGPTYTETLP